MKEQDQQLIESYFKNHRAYYRQIEPDLEELLWSSGSTIHKILYLRRRNVLFVCGDLGEAVYVWSEHFILERIAGCSLDYFASKCQASEDGRGYPDWDEAECLSNVRYWLEDEGPGKTWDEFVKAGGKEAAQSKFEWNCWLGEHGYDFFGSDYGECCEAGKTVAVRCQLHLLGLKAAMDQIRKGTAAA